MKIERKEKRIREMRVCHRSAANFKKLTRKHFILNKHFIYTSLQVHH